MGKLDFRGRSFFVCAPQLLVASIVVAPSAARAEPTYATLNFGSNSTFLTGIRGDNIVGNYVIPGTSNTGGLLYDIATNVWTPFPAATANGSNFPGATSSSPYGPSVGEPNGILRAVGSYKTSASALDHSYLYDGAAAPGLQITSIDYPNALNTIAHSTFGNQLVGNYDTRLATGNAMIYNIRTGAYTTNNMPGAVSTTAYGIWGDKIAGGYAMAGPGGGIGFEHGYIYDQSTGTWTTYDHPGAVFTHFEGITGAGRADEYNLVANWGGPDGQVHASVLHIGADGSQTWIELEMPNAQLSSNSAYGDKVIGISVGASGAANGYVATIPGIYNPIRNTGTLNVSTPGLPALSGRKGDDIVNDGVIITTGALNSAIRSETYGVVTNNGVVSVAGPGSAAIDMHGRFGTLLNGGIIQAAPGAYAIRTGASASGTMIVNRGVIDGAVSVTAGPEARFENSGWLGVSSAGAGVTHAISGVFAQTSAGTLALRLGAGGNDALRVDGVARLGGSLLAIAQPGNLLNSYTVLTATAGYTGTFSNLSTVGVPSFVQASLGYGSNAVTLNLTSRLGQVGGLGFNQTAVGAALDNAFNSGGGLPAGLGALFALSQGQLPGALGSLSGEIHATLPSTLVVESNLAREAILGRLRGDVVSTPAGDPRAPRSLDPTVFGFWGQGIGAWGRVGADGNAASIDRRTGGFVIGADVLTPLGALNSDVRLGVAGGYLTTTLDLDALQSRASTSSVFGALYAGTTIGAWRLSGGALYLGSRFDSGRAIQAGVFSDFGRSDQNASALQAFGEVGYALFAGSGTIGSLAYSASVEPFVNAAAMRIRTDGFAEAGGAAALVGFAGTYDIGTATVGARLVAGFGSPSAALPGIAAPFTLRASLGWRSAFGDVDPAALMAFRPALPNPGALSAFAVSSVPIDRGAIVADIGVDWRVTNALTLGVSYVAQAGSRATDQALKGKLDVRF